jgi:selT/selW/selH-like putative selenoprotein
LGKQLEDELGAEIGLISGSGGVFEVHADGKNIFSKKQLNRFPYEGEIVSLLSK